MNPNELHDTFEAARKQALIELAAGDDHDDVFLVYCIKDQEWGTKYGVCSENQFLATSHQWLHESDIVYSTDQELNDAIRRTK